MKFRQPGNHSSQRKPSLESWGRACVLVIPGGAGMSPQADCWTARRVFDLLAEVGPLRVISVCGPSVFEAICDFGEYEIRGGMLNAITAAYHWHFQLSRFGHVHSHDTIHKRSGRRVLFLELREEEGKDPFLLIYLYRPANAEFQPEQEKRFAKAHAELGSGKDLEKETGA